MSEKSLVVECQEDALREFCLDNFLRIFTEPFDELDLMDDPLPKFGYEGQVSQGEERTRKPFLLLVLNERAGIKGILIEFKDCHEIEVQMVIEQIQKIAFEVIDFGIRLSSRNVVGVLNTECYYEPQ